MVKSLREADSERKGGRKEGGKEGRKEKGAVKQMKKHSSRIPQTGGGRERHARDDAIAVVPGRHSKTKQFFNHGQHLYERPWPHQDECILQKTSQYFLKRLITFWGMIVTPCLRSQARDSKAQARSYDWRLVCSRKFLPGNTFWMAFRIFMKMTAFGKSS